jgi:hypothetical protein
MQMTIALFVVVVGSIAVAFTALAFYAISYT